MFNIGIDPGWKNLGLAILECGGTNNPALVCSVTLDPSKSKTMNGFILELDEVIQHQIKGLSLDSVCIERYVPFKGVPTPNSEDINKIIGALCLYFETKYDVVPIMVRSIDWKMKLVKALFKTGKFTNPSTSLDKKFSLAAAKFCCEITTKITHHEADATCLSYFPLLLV